MKERERAPPYQLVATPVYPSVYNSICSILYAKVKQTKQKCHLISRQSGTTTNT